MEQQEDQITPNYTQRMGEKRIHLERSAHTGHGHLRSSRQQNRWIEIANQDGLKYNVNAEHILYVTADELLEGLYEPGEFY
jgi:hypothetical protein